MSGKPLVQHFVEDLEAIINKYRGEGLTVSEAIGSLEIVKLDVYSDEKEDDEEDIF